MKGSPENNRAISDKCEWDMGSSILVLQKGVPLCQTAHLRGSWDVPFLTSREVPTPHKKT